MSDDAKIEKSPQASVPMQMMASVIQALHEQGYTTKEIARETGCTSSMIRRTLRDPRTMGVSEAVVKHLRKSESEKLTYAAHRAIDRALFSNEVLEKATFQQLAMATAIFLDKRQLLEGKPTQIHANELSDEEIHRRLAEIRDELVKLGATNPDYKIGAVEAQYEPVDKTQPANADGDSPRSADDDLQRPAPALPAPACAPGDDQ